MFNRSRLSCWQAVRQKKVSTNQQAGSAHTSVHLWPAGLEASSATSGCAMPALHRLMQHVLLIVCMPWLQFRNATTASSAECPICIALSVRDTAIQRFAMI